MRPNSASRPTSVLATCRGRPLTADCPRIARRMPPMYRSRSRERDQTYARSLAGTLIARRRLGYEGSRRCPRDDLHDSYLASASAVVGVPEELFVAPAHPFSMMRKNGSSALNSSRSVMVVIPA